LYTLNLREWGEKLYTLNLREWGEKLYSLILGREEKRSMQLFSPLSPGGRGVGGEGVDKIGRQERIKVKNNLHNVS